VNRGFMSETPQIMPTIPASKPHLRARRRLWRDVVEIILLVVLTYTPINLMTARAIVEGPSMQPNFHTGNLVIVNRAAYFFSAPQRGDVVVLHNPNNPNNDDLIKRVIGLPGETVEIRAGVVYVNGTPIDEPYIRANCGLNCNGLWTLTADEYFILGDNRPNSYDSHNFGPVKRELIVGQAWIKYWPIDELHIIEHPRYSPVNPDYTPPPPTPTRTPNPASSPSFNPPPDGDGEMNTPPPVITILPYGASAG
jgi:signal peptidase I